MEPLGQNDHPIHDIARLGTAKEMENYLKAHPQARDIRTAQGAQAIHFAATNGDSGVLRALLKAGAEVNARDGDGATPLHLAAYANRADNALLLLEAGADVKAKTNIGRDATSMARKTRADETAGVISLWVLKGCQAGKKCL